MRLGLALVALLGLVGCAYDQQAGLGDTDDFIDKDEPPGNCSAGTGAEPCPDPGASTGVPEGEACRESGDCASGNACIAPFVGGEVGDFVCTAQCIPLMDEASWCVDASACCDVGAVCSARGLCIEGGLDDSGSDGSGTTDDGTGTDGSEGTSSSGSEGGSEGSGSDTGTGTTGAMEGR